MKMTKKILIGAVAAAAMAFTFTGCDLLGNILSGESSLSELFMKQYGTQDVIDYTDNDADSNGLFTVKSYVNESSTEMVRSMRFQQLEHHGIEGIVTITPNDTKSSDGVMGVVFGANVNTDSEGNELGTMNFGLVGLRVNNGDVGYYVSYFANVASDDLGKSNFGTSVVKNAVDTSVTTSYEIRFQPKTGSAYKNISDLAADENGKVQVYLEVTEDKSTGDYTVNLYKVADSAKTGDAIETVKVPAETLGRTYGTSVCGAYANVYASKTLTASFALN